ncbi:MAG TPA: TonB-dependent receptor plug domain-containing protein [Phenylobacterium sp.]|jgi:outer membrane receptor protein involved in Fe transport|nr:TonB-dependent receptor plug domain-containing protein [Phenylobacterium sp.]
MNAVTKLNLLAGAACAALSFPVASYAADAASASNATVQELVVTADKREEKIQDVPMAVTALGGAELDKLQVRSFADYAALVPGLTDTSGGPGVNHLILRGLSSSGASSTVAVYVDETPMGSSSGLVDGSIFSSDFDTFDMQRIEVLRGPQGTLYGANAEGGLLKFVTNAPDPKAFAGEIQATGEGVTHGQNGYTADGMVNIPLGDKAALRITGFHQELPGWIDDPRLGEKDVNHGHKDGLRVSFLYQPTDNFSLRLTGFGQDLSAFAGPSVDVDRFTLAPLTGELTQNRFIREPSNISYRDYNAKATWDFGLATLVSSTSYGKVDTFVRSDPTDLVFSPPTGTLGQVLSSAFKTNLGGLEDAVVNDDKFTQEFRLSSPASDHFEWQLGAYYTRETGDLAQVIDAFTPSTGAIFGPVLETVSLPSIYKEWAGFGDVTYHFNPQFDVEVGGRVATIKQSSIEALSGALVGVVAPLEASSSESVGTFSVAPRYHLSQDTMIYGRVASGFRPGGPNLLPVGAPAGTPSTYQSDSTINYEVGVKSTQLDGRLQLDVAAFYIDWTRIQITEKVNNVTVTGNGSTARSAGVEWNTTWVPLQGLTFSFNGAYTDAELTADAPSIGGLKGDFLAGVPRWSGALDGEYEWQPMDGYQAYAGFTWSYMGERKNGFTTAITPPTGRIDIPAYNTVNLRLGVDYKTWGFQLFAKNVADERGIISLSPPGQILDLGRSETLIEPRTLGFLVSKKF